MEYDHIQIFPTRKRIVLNDKATRTLFSLTPEQFDRLINGNNRRIVEKKNYKKKGKIKSGYRLETSDNYINIAPLIEFDRDVFDAVISEFEAGNRVISLAMIQRALRGKAGKDNHSAYTTDPDDDNKKIDRITIAEIRKSLIKMMCTIYDADILEAYTELKYEGAERVKKAPILPGEISEVKLNGRVIEVFVMTKESPLYTIAKIKGQILTYEAAPLDVPNQNNTKLVIMLKNYSLRRVNEIKQHKMTATLTLDDIFSKCGIKDDSKRTKQHARETLDKFFAHLQSIGEIKSYEWTKNGNKFYSIKITY
jgi:hypothetical protein